MSHQTIGRRTFLTRAGTAALTAAGALHVKESRAQEPVPNSSGTEAPKLKAPTNTLLLFTKVDTPPVADPQQTAVWHFGWHVTDIRKKVETYQAGRR